MITSFIWEKIDDQCDRVEVIGGWVLRSKDIDDCNTHYTVLAMVFIPDPGHDWKIRK